MTSSRKRARIELLDIAKAITIFLVIVGHTTSNTDTIIGMHAMGIFLLHKPLLQEILMPLASTWIPGHQLIAAIVASTVALVLCMGLCVVIEHYIPELLG